MQQILNTHELRMDHWRMTRALITVVGGLLWVLGSASVARGQTAPDAARPADQIVSEGIDAAGRLKLSVNKTTVIKTRSTYKRVSVGQPEIADVNPIGPGNILVTAKKVGSTQLIIWDESDHSQVIDVTIEADLQAMRDELKGMFPGSKIEVTALNGALALQGRVPNLRTAEQAVAVVTPYTQKVLNFLEISGGQQVMLQVRFAEVSRGAIRSLGVSTYLTDGTSQIAFLNGPVANPAGALAKNQTFTFDSTTTAFGSAHFADMSFEYLLAALKNNNLLRILAEPNLIAISGEEANFLAGGEIPVPVPQSGSGGTAITIEYKQFGVKLSFVPIALGDGSIRLKVSPEVSDLDFSNAVTISGSVIPALTKRNVNTTVELADGQTFAIAGLLNSRVQASRSSTPGLGEVPVLGALFRSVRYERKETELVVLVTPRLVSPMNPDQVPQLPGEHWRHPSEAGLYLINDLGSDESGTQKPEKRPTTMPNSVPARFHGSHGFVPSTQPQADASSN